MDRLEVVTALLEELEAEPETIANWRRKLELRREQAELEGAARRKAARADQLLAEIARNTRPRLRRTGMKLEQKVDYVRRHGKAKYLALPE